MYCRKCGFQFEGKFCPKCGEPITSTSAEESAQKPLAGRLDVNGAETQPLNHRFIHRPGLSY